MVFAPLNLDTSAPLSIRVSWIAGATGQMDWKLNMGIVNTGDTITTTVGGAPTTITGEQHISTLQTASAINTRYTTTMDLDVSKVIARRSTGESDEIWLSLARDGTAGNANDTIIGSVYAIQISPTYCLWCQGAHM